MLQPITQATGRRKTATATVRLYPGTGAIWINKRPIEQYFPTPALTHTIKQPLKIIDALTKYQIHLTIRGGGTTGQTQAARHAIARAIASLNPDDRVLMRTNGFLTRDPRMVERKKYGQPKARKKFTWVKR